MALSLEKVGKLKNKYYYTTMNKFERRKYPRVEKHFRVNYSIPGSSNAISSINNISACGLSFDDKNPIDIGTVIKLHLKSSKTDEHELIGLSLIAKIVRYEHKNNGYQIGTEFKYVPKRTFELLEVYLYPAPEE